MAARTKVSVKACRGRGRRCVAYFWKAPRSRRPCSALRARALQASRGDCLTAPRLGAEKKGARASQRIHVSACGVRVNVACARGRVH